MKWEVDLLNNTVKGNGWEFQVKKLGGGVIDCISTVIPDDADINTSQKVTKEAGNAYMKELQYRKHARNSFATRARTRDAQITLRLNHKQKEKYIMLAEEADMSLSDWILTQLDKSS